MASSAIFHPLVQAGGNTNTVQESGKRIEVDGETEAAAKVAYLKAYLDTILQNQQSPAAAFRFSPLKLLKEDGTVEKFRLFKFAELKWEDYWDRLYLITAERATDFETEVLKFTQIPGGTASYQGVFTKVLQIAWTGQGSSTSIPFLSSACCEGKALFVARAWVIGKPHHVFTKDEVFEFVVLLIHFFTSLSL